MCKRLRVNRKLGSCFFYACIYSIHRYLLSIYYGSIFILGMDILGEWGRQLCALVTHSSSGVEGTEYEQVNK